jgi:nicotinate-nucleotide--dimethylbenzimidazole phosphoribosyltransferase
VTSESELEAAIGRIAPLDDAAMAAAGRQVDQLTKPSGSLGRLEELLFTVAGITGRAAAPVARRHIVVMAGDHGVVSQGVSAYPAEVTPQMVANFMAGGAAINAFAEACGAALTVVDVGLRLPIPDVPDALGARGRSRGGRLVRARVGDGTADITAGPAMSRADAIRALGVGMDVVRDLRSAPGLDVLAVGEMGIGNTTSASAIVAALTGEPADRVTGRGTGVDDVAFARKVDAVARAVAVNRPDPGDPIGVLAAVGGYEIAGLVGLILAAAAERVPVVLDGFITGAAALVAAAFAPRVRQRLIASHLSPEPGHRIVLERLELRPYLDLEMRLGEGTGAALVLGLLATAALARDQMATFGQAEVSGRVHG